MHYIVYEDSYEKKLTQLFKNITQYIMNKINILLTIFLLLVTQSILAQRPQQRQRQRARQRTSMKTDANIVGHVVSNGTHIPFATEIGRAHV